MILNGKNNFQTTVETILKTYRASLNPAPCVDYLPYNITMEPTNRCNLRCVHCYHGDKNHPWKRKSGFMDFEIYKKVIGEIKRWAAHITLNAHGEPLLHPRILDMVKLAKDSGLAVSILTNATMLKPEISDALIEARLDRIVFSFEGSCKEIHERVRRGSRYERTLAHILYFLIANKKHGSPIFVCMSMVDGWHTHDDVKNYGEYFGKLPVDTIFYSTALNFGASTAFGKEVSVSPRINLPFKDQPMCRVPWEDLTVCWDGSVCACPVDAAETHIVGNAASETIESIWNNPGMRQFRQNHLDRNFLEIEKDGPLCAKCNFRLDDEEADFSKAENLAIKKIVRQAGVYAQQLAENENQVDDAATEDNALYFAIREYERLKNG